MCDRIQRCTFAFFTPRLAPLWVLGEGEVRRHIMWVSIRRCAALGCPSGVRQKEFAGDVEKSRPPYPYRYPKLEVTKKDYTSKFIGRNRRKPLRMMIFSHGSRACAVM